MLSGWEKKAGNNVEQPQIMPNQLILPTMAMNSSLSIFFATHPQLRNFELPVGS
jgi:hypothetical protein